jgi:hypothetical protein
MEPMGAQLIVPSEIEKGDTYGTRNFIVAARRADPGHHRIASRIPSLRFGDSTILFQLLPAAGRLVAGIHRINLIGNLRLERYL